MIPLVLRKKIIQLLQLHSESLLSQLRMISFGVLIFFILAGLSFWLNDASAFFTWFTSWYGILSILFFFIFFVEVFFIVSTVSTYAFWVCAKKLRGEGTYFQTCTALLLTMVYTIFPFGLFFVLLQFDEKTMIHKISCVGIVVSMIWGIVALVQKFSKIHHVSGDRAFCIWLVGMILQVPIVLPILFLTHTYMRILFIILMPISIQVLTSLTVIWTGFNVSKVK